MNYAERNLSHHGLLYIKRPCAIVCTVLLAAVIILAVILSCLLADD